LALKYYGINKDEGNMEQITHHQRNARTKLRGDSTFGALNKVRGEVKDILVFPGGGCRCLVDFETGSELKEMSSAWTGDNTRQTGFFIFDRSWVRASWTTVTSLA
jgi:hypothetical protein